ncbi:MAG TPA: folylpolyglutamate synthase/dihydrofolate synthase family protein [Thermoplasmata archaeon]|nr:folylpolyglutamate synthase/dihydrofolate synthase family protein [Thermoplasmata archaeon]
MAANAYRATLEQLFQRRRFGIRPGLEVISALLHELDDPQRSFRSVHVAGSKGKGSTAAMIAAILNEQTGPVGLFTSPHLQSFRERIRVGGRTIGRAAVVRGLARVEEAAQRLEDRGTIDRPPTFFEATTALAFAHFAERGVRAAVVEVGIGGRLDSTNVLDAPVGVITSIELEHTELLGTTLAAIAGEKAGILHRGMRAVSGVEGGEARTAIDRAAAVAGVPVWHLDEEIEVANRAVTPSGQTLDVRTPAGAMPELEVPLHGLVQAGNAGLAVAGAQLFAEAIGFTLSLASVRRGLGRVRWRGRLELVERRPELFVDVAHTPGSMRALAHALGELRPMAPPEESAIVFGCLREKRVAEMLEALSPLAKTLIAVPVRSERSATAAEVRRVATGRFSRVCETPSLVQALTLARAATGPDGYALVVGSDYLVGEALDLIDGATDDEPDLSDPGTAGTVPGNGRGTAEP